MTEPNTEPSTEHDAALDEDDRPIPEEPVTEETETEAVEVTAESLRLELPADPAEATAVLLREIYAARTMSADYLDQLQRKAAEFDNYRKRTLREQAQIREFGSERLVSALLPALDSFDAALALPAESEAEQRLLAGMKGTYDQLMDAVSREGLEVVPAVGAPFDPTVHEAVASPPNASGPLVVTHEVRRGYRLKDKVLRASLVALGEADDAVAPETDEKPTGTET